MKYIFIDSNQYRHLYSSSEGFSQDVYDLLMKLIATDHVQLLLPAQTKNEVERNSCRPWPEAENKSAINQIERLDKDISKLLDQYGTHESHKKLLKDLKKEKTTLIKQKDLIIKKYENKKSKPNQKLKKIFEKARIIEETKDICDRARLRFEKGNPPYDDKLGDSLVWESILDYLTSQKRNKPELIFVAHDKNAWGDDKFDSWLNGEFHRFTNGKILYSKKLSDIPEFTKEEQDRLRKQELDELKQNAIGDFINSGSFVSAGSYASKLLPFKDIFTDEERKQIIKASLTNHEIYQSFFTAIPLKQLFEGKDGYAVQYAESVPDNIWEKFNITFSMALKRQKDDSFKGIDPNDIPF